MHQPDMLLQVAFKEALMFTCAALESRDTFVHSLAVHRQFPAFVEGRIALVATKRFGGLLLFMYRRGVPLELCIGRERAVTFGAHERLYLFMHRIDVRFQDALQGGLVVALVARVRRLLFVNRSDVPVEIARS